MYDLLVKNGTVIDGSGEPGYAGSVASLNGKITILPADTDAQAKTTIDANGLIISPGFIDPHSHGDVPLGREFASLSKISQGITTHVTGQCGFSMAPVNPDKLELISQGLSIFTDTLPENMATFTTFENYLKYAKGLKLPENVKFMVGHVMLRIAAMGYENRKATPAELEHMKSMMREAMESGAGGFSSGLIYIPSAFADTDELAEIAKVVKEYNGLYTTHMRNEANDVEKSVAEAIEVARKSGVKTLISHHKVCGKQNWGNSVRTLKMIADANAEGLDVKADQYPYTASMTHLNVCIPPKYFTDGIAGMVEHLKNPATRAQIRTEIEDVDTTAFENQVQNCGGFDGVFISRAAKTPEVEGQTIGEYARQVGKDPYDVLFDVLIANNGVASAIYFSMCEDDVFRIIQDENVVVGTDGIVKSAHERAHPRAYGSFPRAISYFVKEKKVLPLETMIAKMTSRTAKATMIDNKGLIRDGYDADLVVFDYDNIRDTATFIDSNLLSDGIEYVIVGGEVVYKDKQLTGATPGKILLQTA